MSDRLTDEQLREMATPGMPPIGAIMAVELLSLRARVDKLEAALRPFVSDHPITQLPRPLGEAAAVQSFQPPSPFVRRRFF